MPSEKIEITALDAAERQLRTAIRLFFAQGDPVSIETLTGAATGILRKIGKEYGIKAAFHDSDLINPKYRREAIDKIREPINFFKHGGNQISGDKIEYNLESTKFMIMESCHLIRHLYAEKLHERPIFKEGFVFEVWFSFAHPQYIINHEQFQRLTKDCNPKWGKELSSYCDFLRIPQKF